MAKGYDLEKLRNSFYLLFFGALRGSIAQFLYPLSMFYEFFRQAQARLVSIDWLYPG
jgi:hypothetical protein